KVGVVISGGNIDPNLLGKALQQGLVSAGRYLAFRTWLDDKPGMLHDITGVLAREHINILHVGIHRLGPYAALGRVGLDVIVDTRDRAHAEQVLALLRANGFAAEELLDTAPSGYAGPPRRKGPRTRSFFATSSHVVHNRDRGWLDQREGGPAVIGLIRALVIVEAATFLIAGALHLGVSVPLASVIGEPLIPQAGGPESVIGLV